MEKVTQGRGYSPHRILSLIRPLHVPSAATYTCRRIVRSHRTTFHCKSRDEMLQLMLIPKVFSTFLFTSCKFS